MTKQEFDTILNNNNLSRKDFAQYTGIKYTTVGKWNDDNRPIPSWVESWLENYIEKCKFATVKKTLRDSGVCGE